MTSPNTTNRDRLAAAIEARKRARTRVETMCTVPTVTDEQLADIHGALHRLIAKYGRKNDRRTD